MGTNIPNPNILNIQRNYEQSDAGGMTDLTFNYIP